MGLDMLNFSNLYLTDTLLHDLLDEVQTLGATDLLVLFKHIFEVCSNAPFNISRDLDHVLAVDDPS